ncbi:MAG: DUF448 domain-containing protein [Silicimonas sp.]|nr:DUF448 domain-containing protein [Silicimonas sp.]
MSLGGKDKTRNDPERRCIVSGEAQPKRGLIRFAVSPDGVVVPDVLEKLPGRGIWVAADRAALEAAVKKGLFARAAKQAVTVPETLVADVEALLVRRLIDGVSMARKAGRAIAGYEKVRDWLGKEDAEGEEGDVTEEVEA